MSHCLWKGKVELLNCSDLGNLNDNVKKRHSVILKPKQSSVATREQLIFSTARQLAPFNSQGLIGVAE